MYSKCDIYSADVLFEGLSRWRTQVSGNYLLISQLLILEMILRYTKAYIVY